MRLGATLPQFTDDPEKVLDAARRAERAGLDSLWLFDHLWPLSGGKSRPILECWSTLAWVAAQTQDITIGTLVTRSSLRNPHLLAHMAATVAQVAPGRLVVGIGSGDARSRPENLAFGIPYWAGEERHAQLVATVETVRSRVAGRARVWVAGHAEALRLVAGRIADGWNGWDRSPEAFAREAALVDGCEVTWGGLAILGRDDDDAERRVGTRNPSHFVIGGPGTIAAHLARLAQAGAGHLVMTFPDAGAPGPYEMLGGEVKPRLLDLLSRSDS
ncbi:MAG TPA: LLM class flavin-dependent oxidoreductase [Actinomycetota bacterium]|nr:LLM class flavin-dependent oxidoreductase [Actinomycetota bacterium]